MKHKGQNIINDTDITMTNTGHSLSEVIQNHEEAISNLKSNVKWMYKYGGVGTGSGGGSSESSTPWSFKVEIDEVARVNNSKINLGKQGEYKLAIQLYKVQNRTFTIKYTYSTENGVKIVEKIIPPTQSPLITDVINLQVNGTLSIAINDDEGNFDLFSVDYIVTAYSFSLNYVTNDGKVVIPEDNNIFINDIIDKGLKVDFNYVIATDIESAYFIYTDWTGQVSEPIELFRGSEHILLDLGKEIIDDNAGNYTFVVEPHIILSGNSDEEIIEPIKLQDNLIPTDIYLKVETDGIIYENNTIQNPYQFYAGINVFRITPYQGYLDKNSNYTIEVYLNSVLQIELPITELQDQTRYSIEIITDVLQWNEIRFKISRKNQTYIKTYYFYTKNPLGSFNWYPSYSLGNDSYNITPIKSYQYKKGGSIYNGALAIPGITSSGVEMILGADNRILECPLNFDQYKDKDCLISIGIDYSKLNDVKHQILQISGTNTSIDIYQNYIQFMNQKYENFYLPIETGEYHLISIYRRATTKINGQAAFEYVIYIDGVMETATSSFIQTQDTYNKITLFSGLYSINYLEISYFQHTVYQEISDNLLEQYNPNPYKYQIDYLNDSGILYHYYSYYLTFYPENLSENFKTAYTYVSQFHSNYKTGRIEVTQNIITQVAQNIAAPVLLLEYVEPRTNESDWSSDGESLMNWLETRYDITINSDIINIPKSVKVYYSKGTSDLKEINTPPNTYFNIYLQGTSTLLYKSKNLDLAIESSEDTVTYLYSPNFDNTDTSTFLPEKRFTIKADVVDSSHSNNNSIGKFINTVTTKFNDAKQPNSKYSGYIKNALEGFPVLLFLKNCYYVNATTTSLTEDYYFLGISNFNLGRDSEFNLGYKDLRLLPELIPNGFAISKIENDQVLDDGTAISVNSYLDKFEVAEIRENRNYFDFSQSDRSILFPLSNADTDYMFSKFKSNNEDILKNNLTNLVSGVSKSGGYIFDQLHKNMLENDDYTVGYKSADPQNLVSNYKKVLKRTYENATSVLTPTGEMIQGTQADLITTILGDDTLELDPLLDYKALCEYYVICMALGLLDSVLKNLNLKKWKNRYYPSFYDMDTGLGKDNAGNNALYTAFSDYWIPADHTLGGKIILDPAMSYKDWFPKEINTSTEAQNMIGFDIPMTYLFAIAKYAYHTTYDFNSDTQWDINLQLKDWYPNNLWARYRRKNKNINAWTLPLGVSDAHIGCLESADSFIQNFYKTHLSNIPDVFFNLNYRTKYLQINPQDTTQFIIEEYKKLSGKRIYVVRDWLNSRFHLLDLYFNLASVPDSIQQYDLNTHIWSTIPNSTYALPSTNFIDSSNDDITILQDIFSTGGSTKYSSDIKVTFSAESYSPLCLSGAIIGRYIAESNSKEYTLEVASSGKALNLGGSGSWTKIDSINTLIQGGSFYVTSDKLTTLYGTSGSCGSWSINLPALTNVMLTSVLYSGTLQFQTTETTKWPNLTSIDIHGSKLGLNLDGLNVKQINADNVILADQLVITNCNRLTNLSFKNAIFNNIQIPALDKVSFFSTYRYTQNSDGTWKQTTISAESAKCKALTLKRAAQDGVVFITDQIYTNNGKQEGLQTLTLDGYKEIYIDNCPYLENIVINNPSIVEKLEITNCGNEAVSFSINSETLNIINLSNFNSLNGQINFYNTQKFTKIYLPNNVQLKKNAFTYTSITTLDGVNIKLAPSAFQYAHNFTLKQTNGNLCSFENTVNYPDLSYTFYMTNVSKETFDSFNNQYRTLLGGVTNAQAMWGYCSQLRYTEDNLKNYYTLGTRYFDLSMYSNVTNASQMLAGYYSNACDKTVFQGLGANSDSLDISNFFGWNEQSLNNVYVPIDWLDNIKTKVINCNSTSNTVIYNVVNGYDGTEFTLQTEFKPYTLFGGSTDNKLTSIENWNFAQEHIIDLGDNGFSLARFPKLTKISYSFCGCDGKNLSYNQTIDGGTVAGGFLYNKTSTLVDIAGSFGFNNYNTITVNMGYFLPWDNLIGGKLFQYVVNWDEKYHVMEFNKIVDNSQIFCNIYNALISKSNSTSLAHVFRNCTILTQENIIFDKTKTNTTITSIPYLFSGLKMKDQNEEIAINWDWDLISTLPNVVDFRHAFEKIHFSNTIPFNFFKTRTRKSENVYIKSEDSEIPNIPATLLTFSYSQKIENLEYCFANCKFDVHTFLGFIPFNSISELNSKSCVYWYENEELKFGDTYYRTQSAFASPERVINTEFDDFNKLVSTDIEIMSDFHLTKDIVNWEDINYINFNNYDAVNINHPFISPDFFYSCTTVAKLTSCFEECDLQGYIPDYLFKNCKQATINNFIKNVLIFPKYYADRYNDSFTELLYVYYYIGSNFIQTTILDNAFNFKVQLPGTLKSIEEGLEGLNLYVFCFKDSFNKNITSCRYMLPSVINDPQDGSIFTIQHYDNKIYLNSMYDKNTEIAESYTQEDGNTIIRTKLGNLGFDLTYYNSLYADNLINYLYSQFIYGNVFDSYTLLSSIKKRYSTDTSWVIQLGTSQGVFGVSANAIWPYTNNSNNKTIYAGYIRYSNINGVWSDSETGIQIYKTNVNNYTDIVKERYNNSRSNITGYAINFI